MKPEEDESHLRAFCWGEDLLIASEHEINHVKIATPNIAINISHNTYFCLTKSMK